MSTRAGRENRKAAPDESFSDHIIDPRINVCKTVSGDDNGGFRGIS